MSGATLLIANRGEIAMRVARTARELGYRSIGIYTPDDANSAHRRVVDHAVEIPGTGPGGYLNADAILDVAQQLGVSHIHPGYGFLAENSAFAAQARSRDIRFVGPSPSVLELFGDKRRALSLALEIGVPCLANSDALTNAAMAEEFFASLPDNTAMLLKATAGGGGRGMRVVHSREEIDSAYQRCASEASNAFGDGTLYAEEFLQNARHIEVQVLGDGQRSAHLFERECSLQRQRQKIVEIAPAPDIHPTLRKRLTDAAIELCRASALDNVATVEFLVTGELTDADARIAFIECNPRIQVEHTVTEEVTGLDLVALQLHLANGTTLDELDLREPRAPQGQAIQFRINMESMQPDGMAYPASGTLTSYEPPGGRGVRVDGCGYTGYETNPAFDSLLAKLIVHAPNGDLADALTKARGALAEFSIVGVHHNIPFLRALANDPDVMAGRFTTETVADNASRWLQDGPIGEPAEMSSQESNLAGARLESSDPLAVLDFGKQSAALASDSAPNAATPGTVVAPMPGTIVEHLVAIGSDVQAGTELLVMEAMKMEHVIRAHASGQLTRYAAVPGDTVVANAPLAEIRMGDVAIDTGDTTTAIDLSVIRPDLAEVIARVDKTLDAMRPEAVAKRRRTGQQTTRENIGQLIDEGTFVEYGGLTLAARRLRMPMDELIERTPADGLVCGVGQVNSQWFGEDKARTMVVAYDYTVLAGTQGKKNHQKKDRMFELAHQWRIPLVLFAEGGGGRPGDTDVQFGANLQVEAFERFGKLSGLVPLVGITSGRCFAGNAVLLGCCDVIIATQNSTIGMGGPAMIEGGGLGVYTPEQVGPMSVQVPNGVVDVAVEDEREAVDVARQYLSYFQGPIGDWDCVDQRELRHAIPENRLRVYDVRDVIRKLADLDSVLELRAGYGHGIVTALIRIEGRPMGLIANNPHHLGGAIDSDASDKAARFMQLCDAFDLPILSLCDTPGNMVGPEHETTALVRHCCRMFVIGANITVPLITVVLRKGYGLGAQGMAGGSFHAPLATLSWPTGEFGGMGLEGAVKLGFRDQLAAIEDPDARLAEYEKRVAEMYEKGKAISIATYFELDDVIDPADTRDRVVAALKSVPPPAPREGKKRQNIDTW